MCYVSLRLLKDLCVDCVMVCIHAVRDSAFSQSVEDRWRSSNAFITVNIPSLYPIEVMQQAGSHAAFKQRTKAKEATPRLFDQLPAHAAIQYGIRQKVQVADPLKRGALRIVVEQVPMPVLRRRSPSQNCGNRA